ncbi:reverse transcriptase domain-containing protein [Tanacetum coccineum]
MMLRRNVISLLRQLPLLTTPTKEETLYVYFAAAAEAVSAILLTERKGKQCLIHYVCRMLNEVEKNYAPLEKLALSWRLRRYFEAHLIKVIMDQPLKQILHKAQATGKLAKYSLELGMYNMTYEPMNAIKGNVPADFLLETPVGTLPKDFFACRPEYKSRMTLKSGLSLLTGHQIVRVLVPI